MLSYVSLTAVSFTLLWSLLTHIVAAVAGLPADGSFAMLPGDWHLSLSSLTSPSSHTVSITAPLLHVTVSPAAAACLLAVTKSLQALQQVQQQLLLCKDHLDKAVHTAQMADLSDGFLQDDVFMVRYALTACLEAIEPPCTCLRKQQQERASQSELWHPASRGIDVSVFVSARSSLVLKLSQKYQTAWQTQAKLLAVSLVQKMTYGVVCSVWPLQCHLGQVSLRLMLRSHFCYCVCCTRVMATKFDASLECIALK